MTSFQRLFLAGMLLASVPAQADLAIAVNGSVNSGSAGGGARVMYQMPYQPWVASARFEAMRGGRIDSNEFVLDGRWLSNQDIGRGFVLGGLRFLNAQEYDFNSGSGPQYVSRGTNALLGLDLGIGGELLSKPGFDLGLEAGMTVPFISGGDIGTRFWLNIYAGLWFVGI